MGIRPEGAACTLIDSTTLKNIYISSRLQMIFWIKAKYERKHNK